MTTRKASIVVFLGVTFLFWLTLYLYVPTLPTYVKTKAANLSMVGLVLSMYGLWMAAARLPMGIAVDAMGRGKPLIIAGLFCAAVGAFIMGKGDSLEVLASGRALTGVSAATWVPLLAVFSTFFRSEKAILSSVMLTFTASFGRLVGTSLTGVLNRAGGYPLPFYLAAATGAIAMGLVLLVGEERRPQKEISVARIAKLFTRKDVVLPALISAVVHYTDWGITFGFLPILAQDLGASDVVKSVIISLNIASITVANLLTTFLLKKMRHTLILSAGSFLFFCGIILISFAPSLSWIFGGTITMGFAFGIVYPILLGMSIHQVDRSQRSTAMGIHQSIYALGMWTGPWLTGMIADWTGIRNSFLINGGFYLVVVYVFIFLLVRRGSSSGEK
jgi:MFS family permease